MNVWRSRWAAIGAAIAVTLGAGGLVGVGAASPESTFVAIEPVRVLDTRFDIGLNGAFRHRVGRDLDVTGTIPIVGPGNTATTGTVVPNGATAIVANVTAVNPSTAGFVSVRPATATGDPTTSNLNLAGPGVVVPNSVTVELPTTGGKSGEVNLFFSGTGAGATTHLLLDIVGYFVEGSGVPGPKGDKGDKGNKGDQGDAGPRGTSAWETIPTGVTVTGGVLIDLTVVSNNANNNHFVPFPAKPPSAPTSVNFAPDSDGATPPGDADATCTGSVLAPTAPAGKVCLYLQASGGVAAVDGQPATLYGLSGTEGFGVEFNESGTLGDDMFIAATWAYTAP